MKKILPHEGYPKKNVGLDLKKKNIIYNFK